MSANTILYSTFYLFIFLAVIVFLLGEYKLNSAHNSIEAYIGDNPEIHEIIFNRLEQRKIEIREQEIQERKEKAQLREEQRNREEKISQQQSPPINVRNTTVSELLDEFKSNPIRFNNTHRDRWVEVRGEITEIKKTTLFFSTTYYVTVRSPREGSFSERLGNLFQGSLEFSFEDEKDILRLNNNQIVIIRGRITYGSETFSKIRLSDSQIIR